MTPPAEHANTPAWQDDPAFLAAWGGYSDNNAYALAAAAVAAERAHLATQIQAIRADMHRSTAPHVSERLYAIDAVLAVLRDAP